MLMKHTADDDSESQKRTDVQSPQVCVDYLSYTFDEMDLAASWRVMTKQKKDIANGIRLENASWRTWAKQRNHLKTITPETLNWLKDSDVTWLYGPLHTVTKSEQKDRYSPKESSAHDKLGLIQATDPSTLNEIGITGTTSTPMTVTRVPSNVIPPTHQSQQQKQKQQQQQQQRPLKSALKKVTMSDILRRSASEFHVSDLDRNNILNNNNCDAPGGSGFSLSEANRQLGAFSPDVIATHRQPKLRFNQLVEQYMVISDDDNSSANGSVPKVRMSTHLDNQYNDDDDDDDDDASSDSMGGSGNDDDNDNDNNDDHLHQRPIRCNGNKLYYRQSSRAFLDDTDDELDDDSEDDDEVIMMHPHQSKRRDGQQKNKTSSSYIAPRSIKRIEPTVLKSSSYSDTSRRGSLSSWDDDDYDRRSIHLPDYHASLGSTSGSSSGTNNNNSTNGPDQSIQWEGQPYVVYDVAPASSEVESDFMDDDDWEIRRQSLDSGSCANDMETGPSIDQIDTGNNNDEYQMDNNNSNIIDNDNSKQSTTFAPPTSILSPGKASKSQPISEPTPIDALQHHHQKSTCDNTIDISPTSSSAPCHDQILDQQQHTSSSSVFDNISQWASTYLRKP